MKATVDVSVTVTVHMHENVGFNADTAVKQIRELAASYAKGFVLESLQRAERSLLQNRDRQVEVSETPSKIVVDNIRIQL